MALYSAWISFCDELDANLPYFRAFVTGRPTITSSVDFTLDDECSLEGHLSRVWQAWGAFCRACVCESCLGTIDGNGIAIAPHPSAGSEQHVSSAAKRAKEGKTPYWTGTNNVLRLEPTWGDTDTLTTIVQRLQPSNASQLLAAISSAHTSAKALQHIRNASAHTNPQSLQTVTSLQSGYMSFSIGHPVQALYWIEPISSDFLVVHSIEELRDASLAAIS